MELFGIGSMEFVYILLIILLVFGPKDIAKGARSLGSLINRWRRSDDFHLVKQMAREVRDLPNRLAEEAGLDEISSINLDPPKEVAYSSHSQNAQPETSRQETTPALQEEGSQP